MSEGRAREAERGTTVPVRWAGIGSVSLARGEGSDGFSVSQCAWASRKGGSSRVKKSRRRCRRVELWMHFVLRQRRIRRAGVAAAAGVASGGGVKAQPSCGESLV